jgi:arylsulfatase
MISDPAPETPNATDALLRLFLTRAPTSLALFDRDMQYLLYTKRWVETLPVGASRTRGATIAEVMRSTGYSTSMVGKWHLSKNPVDFGFERYWGHLSGATNYFVGDQSFRLHHQNWNVPKTLNGKPFYTTNAITDFALEFLDEMTKKEDPFLLYVAYNAPHYPLHAPKKDVAKYQGRYDAG